jgi:hypothetical protein
MTRLTRSSRINVGRNLKGIDHGTFEYNIWISLHEDEKSGK